jgi:hypothetical protein
MTWRVLISLLVVVLVKEEVVNGFPEVPKRCAVCVAMVDEILYNLMKEQPQADIPIGDQVRRNIFFFSHLSIYLSGCMYMFMCVSVFTNIDHFSLDLEYIYIYVSRIENIDPRSFALVFRMTVPKTYFQ